MLWRRNALSTLRSSDDSVARDPRRRCITLSCVWEPTEPTNQSLNMEHLVNVDTSFVDRYDSGSDLTSKISKHLVRRISQEAWDENLIAIARSKTKWPPHRSRWPLQTGDLVSFTKRKNVLDCSTVCYNRTSHGKNGGGKLLVTKRSGSTITIPTGALGIVFSGLPTTITFEQLSWVVEATDESFTWNTTWFNDDVNGTVALAIVLVLSTNKFVAIPGGEMMQSSIRRGEPLVPWDTEKVLHDPNDYRLSLDVVQTGDVW